MQSARITVVQAELEWADECAHLSEATRASYAGEARRFREYLGRAGVDTVGQITQQDWLTYLADLTESRSAVLTKRADALKPSSALQAARITRSFLRHCWLQRWLDWVPGVGSQRCPPKGGPEDFKAPASLLSYLLDPGLADDEPQSRQRSTVGLAFWGGFRPREISDLRAGDLVPAAGGGAWLRSRSRNDSVALPEIMVLQLRHYTMLRVERTGPLAANAAVIAQLNSAEPVTAAAAWQILKDWTVAYAPEHGEPVSTRAIREAFKQLAGADAAAYIKTVERQAAGRRRPSRLAPFQVISAQQVSEDLVKKMAGAATVVPQP